MMVMNRPIDMALTMLAPIIWGSSYLVTTEWLPYGYPVTVAALRALPAGLLLLLIVRQLPVRGWWLRVFILGALNFTVFWSLLFVAAYRLPGGVAATVGAVQPLIIIFLAWLILQKTIKTMVVIAALLGILGVALLVLGPEAKLDIVGIVAAGGGALSMAAGTVLTKKWQPNVSLLTLTAWQLTAGGLLLSVLALFIEPPLPELDRYAILGLVWLGLVGAAFSYILWFRALQRLDVNFISMLGFLSPVSALLLGWIVLGQGLTALQFLGVLIVLASIVLVQYPGKFRLKRRFSKKQTGDTVVSPRS